MYLVVGEDTVEDMCDVNSQGSSAKIASLDEAIEAVRTLAESDDSQHFIVFQPIQVIYNSPNVQRDSGESFRKGLPVIGMDDDELTAMVKVERHSRKKK